MKRICLIIASILLLINLVSCGGQTANKNAVTSAQDVQGFWYEEGDSGLLMGFKGDGYILYGFGTQFSVTGTFEVNGQTLIVHPEGMEAKLYESATIEDDILSLETSDGQLSHWKKVSEEEVERMLLEDE